MNFKEYLNQSGWAGPSDPESFDSLLPFFGIEVLYTGKEYCPILEVVADFAILSDGRRYCHNGPVWSLEYRVGGISSE